MLYVVLLAFGFFSGFMLGFGAGEFMPAPNTQAYNANSGESKEKELLAQLASAQKKCTVNSSATVSGTSSEAATRAPASVTPQSTALSISEQPASAGDVVESNAGDQSDQEEFLKPKEENAHEVTD